MRFVLLTLVLLVAGCSLLPFGGNSRNAATPVAEVPPTRPLADGTELVAALKSVVPEPALRGIILRGTGLAQSPGFFNAQMRALNEGEPDENGIVTFEFRVRPPGVVQPQGSEAAREVLAAAFVSDGDLERIAGFRILSATNIVTLRR